MRKVKFFNNSTNKEQNCPCCSKPLNRADKNQKQHIYPNWIYSLFPKNTKNQFELKRVSINNEGQLSSEDVFIEGRFSNFWCIECEKNSSILDQKAKDILFKEHTKLQVGMTPFERHVQQDSDLVVLTGEESLILGKWIRSIVLRLILNEMKLPIFNDLLFLLKSITNEINPWKCDSARSPIFIGIDSSLKFNTIHQCDIGVMNESILINLNIGPIMCIIGLELKNMKFQYQEGKKLPELNQNGTKIPLINNLHINRIRDFANLDCPTIQDKKYPALSIRLIEF